MTTITDTITEVMIITRIKEIKMMRILIVFIGFLVVSCQTSDDHGHAHDEHGNHMSDDSEVPAVDYTIWTDNTELFVEFPALVVGQPSRFAAHFTKMDKHKAITEGSVTVSIIKGENGIRVTEEAPARPGIFTPTLLPKEAGICEVVFDLKTSEYSDRIVIKNVMVYASISEAVESLGDNADDASISFLKEQAWKMKFQTTPVIRKEVYEVISTSGVWKVAPSDHLTLVAPTNGRISFMHTNLMVGSKVKKGLVLLTVQGKGLSHDNIEVELEKAKVNYDQAKSEFERKKSLFESKIIPESAMEKAQQKFDLAASEYENLNSDYSSNGKLVTIPFDGYIKSIDVDNGKFVNQGDPLFTIAHHTTSLLEVQVSPSFAADLSSIQDLWYQPKKGIWSSLNNKGGKIISITDEVDSKRPMLSVFAEILDDVDMPEGSFTEVQISTGSPLKSLVVPTSSLLESYGNYSVIVQLTGEKYERRPITIGNRNGMEVAVLSGLKQGEIVVSIGAYQVKMASMSGEVPSHGHAH